MSPYLAWSLKTHFGLNVGQTWSEAVRSSPGPINGLSQASKPTGPCAPHRSAELARHAH
jgi:hypothetical protein